MKPFAYARPKSRDELIALLDREGARIKGGGIDLLDLAKSGVSTSATLIDVGNLPGTKDIEGAVGGAINVGGQENLVCLCLGGGVTLARLASSSEVVKYAPALADAAGMAATPQIRNVATLAGNLLQRPRCAYFRDLFFDCLKRGGATCPAMEGDHSEGAIFGNGRCCAVHPSNLAVALMAAGAELERLQVAENVSNGTRTGLPVVSTGFSANFFRAPETHPLVENELAPGELILRVLVPHCPASAYVEVDQKQSFDWASASAAVALEMEGGKVKSARVALGAVAPVPLLSEAAAKALVGKVPDEAAAKAAGEAAVEGATPLRDNGHKVQHLRICVQRAVLKAAARGR